MTIKLAATIPINIKTSYFLCLDEEIIGFCEDCHILSYYSQVFLLLARPYDEVKLNCFKTYLIKQGQCNIHS